MPWRWSSSSSKCTARLLCTILLLRNSDCASSSVASHESDDELLIAQGESNPRRTTRAELATGNVFEHAASATGGGALVHPDAFARLTRTLAGPSDAAFENEQASASASASASGSSDTSEAAASMRLTLAERATLEVMRMQPSAIWIDAKSKLYGPDGSATAQGALSSAARRKPPPLVVFVLCMCAVALCGLRPRAPLCVLSANARSALRMSCLTHLDPRLPTRACRRFPQTTFPIVTAPHRHQLAKSAAHTRPTVSGVTY